MIRRRGEIHDDDEFWTWEMAWATFNEVVSEAKTTKICLFIDGLDEFEGDGENLLETVRVLSSYATVKLCFEPTLNRYAYKNITCHILDPSAQPS